MMSSPARNFETPWIAVDDAEPWDDPASATRIAAAVPDLIEFKSAVIYAQACLARMDPSPTTTRLTLAIDMLKRTMASWSTTPPTPEQRWLFREHMDEVIELARSSAPTVRPPRAKPPT